jgi:hypothetical protein
MLLEQGKWYRLNETNVGRLPDGPGVYELSGAGAIVVFIGWTRGTGLRETLRSHIKDPRNPCIARRAFFFRFEASDRPAERGAEVIEAFRAERYGILPECMDEPVEQETASGTGDRQPKRRKGA